MVPEQGRIRAMARMGRSGTIPLLLLLVLLLCIFAEASSASASATKAFEEEKRIVMPVENSSTTLPLSLSGSSSSSSSICNIPKPPSCPVNCFRPDPVCGVNGVTYWCGCAEAFCSGVEVAKLGFCSVGNGGSGLLSGQALLLVHIVWLILLGFVLVIGVP